MENSNKKYGLILPDSSKPTFQASRNVFGNDSDSEEDSGKKPLLRPSDITKRQSKIVQEKAILEDPTVYQYDEVYDSMVTQKETKIVKSKEDKKPKYIENLLKTANKRKLENERRIERQIQKEREKEGEEFADKEVFVTSAYKKKLEELRLEEEKEKREEYLEKIGDVTKQQDLGGFYRHLYEQKLGSDKPDEEIVTNKKSDSSDFKPSKTNQECTDSTSKKRNYRKRKISHDTKSEGEIDDSDDEVNRNCFDKKKSKKPDENIDADSDFSIDESSDEEDKETQVSENSKEKTNDTFKTPAPKSENVEKNLDTTNVETKQVIKADKPKIDIWKKRTVGEVFNQALKRYYERKATRGC